MHASQDAGDNGTFCSELMMRLRLKLRAAAIDGKLDPCDVGGIVGSEERLGCGDEGEVVSEPLSPAASAQSSAQSLVPLTVPTSLQPTAACGFAGVSGLAESFGGAL